MDSIDIPEKSWGAQRDSQTEFKFTYLFISISFATK